MLKNSKYSWKHIGSKRIDKKLKGY
jgi:hypothetical protein